jgi:hypothetical protein
VRQAALALLLALIGPVAAGCAGCGDPPAPPRDAGTTPLGPGPLEVDAVVRENSVEVWVRERERPCSCTTGDFPGEGQCAGQTDLVRCECDPPSELAREHPAPCLQTVRLLDGEELIDELQEGEWEFDRGRSLLSADDGALIASFAQPSLEVVGCERSARVALPGDEPPTPSFERFTSTDDVASVSWTSDQPGSASLLCTYDAVGARCCREPWQPAGTLALRPNDDQVLNVFLQQLRGGDEEETEVGAVRVWHAGGFNAPAPWAPVPGDGGRHLLGASIGLPVLYLAAPDLSLDNEQLYVVEMSVVLDDADPLATLELAAVGQTGTALRYRVDAAGSPIELHVDGIVYEAVGPFTRPEGELVLGDDVPRIVSASLDEVTVRNTLDASDVVTLSFMTTLNLPPIAEPIE